MKIVPRSEWGARHDDGAGPAPLPADEGVFLHHSVTRSENGAHAIRNLENIGESRFGRGISYTFPITPDGTVYQGHSVDRRGAHTGGHNTKARAICLVGNYDVDKVTAEQIESAAQLLAHGVREGWWPTTRLRPHQAVKATACPGRHALAAIPAIVARADALLGAPTPKPPTGDLTMSEAAAIRAEMKEADRKLRADVATMDRLIMEQVRQRDALIVGWAKDRLGATDADVADLERRLADLEGDG